MTIKKRRTESPARPAPATSWEPLAEWYDGWVGQNGSLHHRRLAIPALMALLAPQPHERILDFGAGQGVLAPSIVAVGATYTGIDASETMIRLACQRHGHCGRFLCGDVRRLGSLPGVKKGSFDAVTCLLCLQDMEPLEPVLAAAAWALVPGGRLVAVLTHPCFRVPRQSGWGWDQNRKLRFRRVDHYLTPLAVPLKSYAAGDRQGTTRSFHRPLSVYVAALAAQGLWINDLREIPADARLRGVRPGDADRRAAAEIPLFLALRAVKLR